MKDNEWLINKDFIEKSSFPDKQYFETLCSKVSKFLLRVPVKNIITSWDNKHHRIFFFYGNDLIFILNIDSNISYFDTITLIERRLYPYFPHYECTVEEEEPYDKNEISDLIINDDIDINEAFQLTKTVTHEEEGVIERIILLDNFFVLTIDDVKQSRMSKIQLSEFLLILNSLETGKEKREYIMEQSILIKDEIYDKTLNLQYSPEMLINFFKIQLPDLYKYPLEQLEQRIRLYRWGRFIFNFPDDATKYICLSKFDEFKQKLPPYTSF